MGIGGLTSYINQTKKCSTNFQLHDTPLVIDANAIVYRLYEQRNCNYCFGGDYAEFAHYVLEFFDELLKCNVTPLVIVDGAMKDKKLKTLYKNFKERIIKASISTPCNEQSVLPPLTKEVFKYIMRKKNIKCVTSLYEAYDDIASIARILNCPVLSNDSDFYIFNVIYIPYDTLKPGIIRSSIGNGFFKNCKMFKSENLLKHFPGEDKKVLPLISVLLRNDYFKTDVFKNFFSTLKVPRELKNKFGNCKQRLKVEALFMWIKNYTLDEAVARILNKIDSEEYQSTLKIIEMVINGYLNPSPEMLGPLGYSPEEIEALKQKIANESYKFDNLSNFDITDEPETHNETYLSCDDDVDNVLSDENTDITVYSSIGDLNKIVPSWFMEKFKNGAIPSYFMDLINRQFFVPEEQMEDCNYPACMNISLKIYKIIFQLLNNGTTNLNILKYITRGKGVDIEIHEMNCENSDNCKEMIPTLQQLINLPLISRKEILINTLGVSDKFIVKFPPLWRMYIIAIKYWLVEADEMFRTKCHLYALIFQIICHVIKKVIAYHSYFEMNLSTMHNKCNSNKDNKFPIKEALTNVKENECIFAERFFISKMRKDRDNFNITIVHAFSLFQSCLRSSMELNALLGYPYPNINVAEFFSGTLIYNLYNDLKNSQLNERVHNIFEKSPSVLQVFIAISTTIEAMLQ